MLINWMKHWLARYDAWCEELGLTPENKRRCCAYRSEEQIQQDNKKKKEREHDLHA
ncbi:MAG: hypothetical protein ACK5NC_12535 [Vibrio sp.]